MKNKTNLLIPFLVLGASALIAIVIANEGAEVVQRKRRRRVLKKKKVFISFPFEDKKYRDFLVSQAKNQKSPFSFIDMSVKEPWDSMSWKIECRKKIRKCDGMIVLLSKNTWHSSGSRWEINCANDECVPVVGMHIKKTNKGARPPELQGKRAIEWTWDNLNKIICNF